MSLLLAVVIASMAPPVALMISQVSAQLTRNVVVLPPLSDAAPLIPPEALQEKSHYVFAAVETATINDLLQTTLGVQNIVHVHSPQEVPRDDLLNNSTGVTIMQNMATAELAYLYLCGFHSGFSNFYAFQATVQDAVANNRSVTGVWRAPVSPGDDAVMFVVLS